MRSIQLCDWNMVRPTGESSNRIFNELLELRNQIRSIEITDRNFEASEGTNFIGRKKQTAEAHGSS